MRALIYLTSDASSHGILRIIMMRWFVERVRVRVLIILNFDSGKCRGRVRLLITAHHISTDSRSLSANHDHEYV